MQGNLQNAPSDELGIGFAWNAKREAARDQNNLLWALSSGTHDGTVRTGPAENSTIRIP